MSELEWRRALRDLKQPSTPARDLWPDIAAALDATPSATAKHKRRPWMLAAVVAAAFLLAGGIGASLHGRAGQDLGDAATARVTPADPRLRGAVIELDATREVLQGALQQNPDSPLLRRLLARTERQQVALQHLAHEAG
ncbi:MAG: hypothetical protein EPN56_04235 [Rhodanobacter sp.]|nr:MAG: hypothetical protein EPN66_12325 [Rhodanobacter sp.]TAM36897.1 MAG: hypothetical protein EPN56_04235 [Rhodanobacter sp.]